MQNPEQNLFWNATRTAVLGLALTLGGSCGGEVQTNVRSEKRTSYLEGNTNLHTKPADGSFAETVNNFSVAKENIEALPENWRAMQERRRSSK